MSTDSEKTPASEDQEGAAKDIYPAVDHIASQLDAVQTFIARRFDEISMEINATSQQIDMNEEGTARKFNEIFEVLKAVSYSGDGSTAANAGVELDAVVEMTEQAANKILDAADRISDRIQKSQDSGTSEDQQTALSDISGDIEEIFMACSFQDITGQRIRNTLENLRVIEERLGSALSQIGIEVEATAEDHEAISNKLSGQSEIDAMFNSSKDDKEGESEGGGGAVSQDDIDKMF